MQEALLKAFRSYDRLDDRAAGPAWLGTIVVNCCRDHGRARARRPQEVELDEVDEFSLYRKIADEDPFPYSDSLHLDFLHQFGVDDVRDLLGEMPEIYREPLVLVYSRGLPREGGRLLPAGAARHDARTTPPRAEALRASALGVRRTTRSAQGRGTRVIACSEAVKQLWEYLDGIVDESQRAAIDEHLSFCRRCCGELEFAEELRRFLVEGDSDEIPGDVKARLTTALDDLEAQA